MADKYGGKIGRYRIIEPIGSGGFATVYRAVDERLGCEVALKVLAENHSLVPDYRERFISEAQHLRRVDSYWVASIFDLGETETGQPYMVLELADRGDLETRVNDLWDKRRGLERSDLLVLAETLAHSLSAIHAADLVHRDVTPGNLLVRHNGLKPAPWSGRSLLDRGERLLLSDLGYAKDLRAASGITSGGGTVGFAAPEQHGEVTQVDTRADIYGASAVVHWAATGSRHEEALIEVTQIGMAEDPGDRFPDMSSWNSAIRSALASPYAPINTNAGIEEVQAGWARPALAAVAGLSVGFIAAAAIWFDSDGTTVMPSILDAVTTTSTTAPVDDGDNPDGTEDENPGSTTSSPAPPPLDDDSDGSTAGGITSDELRASDPAAGEAVEISLDRPAAGATVNGALAIGGTARAGKGLVDVRLQVRTQPGNTYLDLASDTFLTEPTANTLEVTGGEGEEVPWGIELAAGRLPSGTYQIKVLATDRAGRASAPAYATVAITDLP